MSCKIDFNIDGYRGYIDQIIRESTNGYILLGWILAEKPIDHIYIICNSYMIQAQYELPRPDLGCNCGFICFISHKYCNDNDNIHIIVENCNEITKIVSQTLQIKNIIDLTNTSYLLTSNKKNIDPLVPFDRNNDINHNNWINYLVSLCDKQDYNILEIGSRVVTGANIRKCFKNAHYTGFDIYAGENVDIVGDAHHLLSYFPDKKFDLIFSSAVFEHLAMPWVVAIQICQLLNIGGYIFIETHYSYSSHERPWHFFQFSEKALQVLFNKKFGIELIKANVDNPILGCFSEDAAPYLRYRNVNNLYCHSEFLGKKIKNIDHLSYDGIEIQDILGDEFYPKPKKK